MVQLQDGLAIQEGWNPIHTHTVEFEEATMNLPIFVLSNVPGATDGIRWEDICHGQKGRKFIFINHETIRHTSR
jgi:hypothetical protein